MLPIRFTAWVGSFRCINGWAAWRVGMVCEFTCHLIMHHKLNWDHLAISFSTQVSSLLSHCMLIQIPFDAQSGRKKCLWHAKSLSLWRTTHWSGDAFQLLMLLFPILLRHRSGQDKWDSKIQAPCFMRCFKAIPPGKIRSMCLMMTWLQICESSMTFPWTFCWRNTYRLPVADLATLSSLWPYRSS